VIPGEEEETASSVSNCCYFVLQENDPGEITWDSFTYPELRNFLLILDREEAWYKKRIHEKYEVVLQVWPLAQFFPAFFFVKKSFMCMEGKSISPRWGNALFYTDCEKSAE